MPVISNERCRSEEKSLNYSNTIFEISRHSDSDACRSQDFVGMTHALGIPTSFVVGTSLRVALLALSTICRNGNLICNKFLLPSLYY